MFNLGFGELVVILVVALIFLGPKLLPEVASGLGKVIREIRKATADIRQDIELDEMIRGPLRELREAATLPPEELKRRDEAKAARQKAEAEAARRREQEANAAKEAKQAEEEERKRRQQATQVDAPPTIHSGGAVLGPTEVVSPGGTMIATPPPSDPLRTLTPLPELTSPPPVVTAQPPRIPVPPLPPPPPPRPAPAAEPTVFDLQAQLRAAAEAKASLLGRPAAGASGKPAVQPPAGKSAQPPAGKKGQP